MAGIGDSFRAGQKLQRQTSVNYLKNLIKKAPNSVQWYSSRYAVGRHHLFNCNSNEKGCYQCRFQCCKHSYVNCDNCHNVICNVCTWSGVLCVKNEYLKGELDEILCCKPCMETIKKPAFSYTNVWNNRSNRRLPSRLPGRLPTPPLTQSSYFPNDSYDDDDSEEWADFLNRGKSKAKEKAEVEEEEYTTEQLGETYDDGSTFLWDGTVSDFDSPQEDETGWEAYHSESEDESRTPIGKNDTLFDISGFWGID